MTEQIKTPEAVKPNETKSNEVKSDPNAATPVPEKGNAVAIDSAAPKAPETEKPVDEKDRKQA